MSKCPIKHLKEAFSTLESSVPKPTSFGDMGWLCNRDSVLSIFSKLKSLESFNGISSENIYGFSFHLQVSSVGMRIGNFLISELGEGNLAFIQPAIYAMDRIISGAIHGAENEIDLGRRLDDAKKILNTPEFFYGPLEIHVLERFPHRVNDIVNDFGKVKLINGWKLCPAYTIMQEICNSIFPHYINDWKVTRINRGS